MTRVALDTNVIVYAELEPTTAKGQRAQDLLIKAARDGVMPLQVLSEFMRVIQRVDPARLGRAVSLMRTYHSAFAAPITTFDNMLTAGAIAQSDGLQSFDAIVVAASAGAGAKVLLSEDMQDGRIIGGLRILNPFNPANDAVIDALFWTQP